MPYCNKCGKEITQGAAFCNSCGAPVEATRCTEAALPVPCAKTQRTEEQEFLETTHRLLRWERTAWSITSKVYLITGIIFAVCYLLFALIGFGISGSESDAAAGAFLAILGVTYAIVIGGMMIAFGIVCKKACQKLPQYIDTLYTDFSLTYNRCSSVGMLVFNVIFGAVSPIFFIINFARMKANTAVIERIMQNQKG